MEICKLKPATKSYIWGGKRLFEYGKETEQENIAESWEVSFNDDGPSIILSGENKGKLLKDIATKKDLGTKIDNFQFFPILNKLIDASNDLSLQVHPNDEYALKNENQFGKTEMWYVVDTLNDACLYVGFNKDVTKEEVKERISNNTLIEIMNKIPVKKGDCFFIPSGTIHAIGKGCLIYEIQENSTLTYRVYDYGRVGKDGKPRELHIEKALKVLNLNRMLPNNLKSTPLVSCNYFTVNHFENVENLKTNDESFMTITIINGEGKINELDVKKGDTVFVPTNKDIKLSKNLEIITTTM